MDFAPTADQREYCAVISDLATALPPPRAGEDGVVRFDQEAWRRCAEAGLLGLTVPAEYGGGGADALTAALAMEALGQGCRDSGLMFSLNAQMWAAQHPIARFGSAEQKQRYLPALCGGELIAAHGMTEPGSGSDAFALRTSAVRDGDKWRLTGSKLFVTNAPVAGLFVVFASTDRNRGFAGLTAFLVPRDTPGLSVGPDERKLGLHGSPMAQVFLDDCVLAADALLGKPGGGAAVFLSSMDWERTLILACVVGAMARQLAETVAFAKEREQFGHPIGEFQAVSHKVAAMRLRLESARLLVRRAAWALDHRDDPRLHGALAKLAVSESYVASSLDALQIRGGSGFLAESGLGQELLDAVGSRLYSGTSETLMNLVAKKVGL
ncbi:acyl-CoA dehydrogenase family protein [Crossiella sp. SN42]|uniref:acyl-CoA dehydrogenase family protein n=1 Tax=Crossiella sp. SN42 TaxID=2944808 RepID=UPI00207CACE8|nr:acyl-CoA dehydrogenase family protein [Crossiella sp. SN42]MCO1577292.1 acyl-CoA dehydrogenase family protein [Crossiella sp. SN42]